jgi:hypothetical protein
MKIAEATEIHSDAQWIMERLSKDCKPFLNLIGSEVTKYKLYRGMPFMKKADSMTKKQIRLDDRKPMSSAQVKHDRYNHFFQEEFGAPFRNALFATGSFRMAQYYGAPFMVFPIGKFEWLWSPDVNDMALDIRWPAVGGQINVPPSQEVVDDKLPAYAYRHNYDLPKAIKSGNEIMIRCKEYYAVKKIVFAEVNF